MDLYNKKIVIGLMLFLLSTIVVTGIIIVSNIKIKKNISDTLPQNQAFPSSNADMTMDNFHFTQTGKDKIEWEVKALKARLFNKESKAVLEDIEAVFTTSEGVRIELRGDEGVFNTESHDMFIRKRSNNTKITASNGYTMITDALSWNNKKRVAVTDDEVLIEGPRVKIKGKGLRINAQLKKLEVMADVEAVIKE